MKKPRILVVSAQNALRYVMKHFCEPGVTEYAEETDTYAAISIQDTYGGGFGFELKKNKYCKDVLTLYFHKSSCRRCGYASYTLLCWRFTFSCSRSVCSRGA